MLELWGKYEHYYSTVLSDVSVAERVDGGRSDEEGGWRKRAKLETLKR